MLRIEWSRARDGLIRNGSGGVYYEPWTYYLRWLLGPGGATFLIVLRLCSSNASVLTATDERNE